MPNAVSIVNGSGSCQPGIGLARAVFGQRDQAAADQVDVALQTNRSIAVELAIGQVASMSASVMPPPVSSRVRRHVDHLELREVDVCRYRFR